MSRKTYRRVVALALGLLCLSFGTGSASAAEFPPVFDPELSLTGDCSEVPPDTVKDPSCPYLPPPDGPSGRFNEPRSIAVDAYGNEYVASYAGGDPTKGRIDVFDDEGKFIVELATSQGPKSLAVDRLGNLYVFEQSPGGAGELVRYTPSLYEGEAGNIAYGNPGVVIFADNEISNAGVAVDFSNDRVFFNTVSAIREYGSVAESNALLNTITHPKLQSSVWVAVDSERRRLFASYCKDAIFECGVLVFSADAPYALLEEIDGSELPAGEFKSSKGWTSIAIDEETGHFYVEDLEQTKNIYEFDESYAFVSKLTFNSFAGGNGALQIAVSNSPLDEEAVNRHYLFVPVVAAAGRAFAFKPPIVRAPKILSASAGNIGETEAELRATIDPEGDATDYVFEYEELDGTPFDNPQLAGKGTIPTGTEPRQVSAVLTGLEPGTAYRFRVTAKNVAGEADPIGEGTFATYNDATSALPCVNHSLRIGASAALPDCRAYELVTPPDTNGRPPKGIGFTGDRFPTVQSSPAGNAVSYVLEGGSLPGTEGTGAFNGDPYRATRDPSSGWSSVLTGPNGTETTVPLPGSPSPDQGHSFWTASGEGSAVVVPDKQARYVRYPDGSSELVGRGSLGTDPFAQGRLITEGGTHIVFQTVTESGIVAQQLEPNAPPTGTEAVYDRTADEVTHVVSLLPGDVIPAAGQDASYVGASADGEGIAFRIGTTLYLRKENAVTYKVAEGADFAGVSEGGERVFYVKGGNLFAYDTTTGLPVPFATTGDALAVNVAPDGSRAYFVSETVLGAANPAGEVAQAGEQNLYLSEEGTASFVATVTERDVEGEIDAVGGRVDGLGLWAGEALEMRQPARDPSRLTPDGSVLLFQSRANLTGYESGSFPQIYRYDSTEERLDCLSCIPTGAPASGGASLQTYTAVHGSTLPFSPFGLVPNLRGDGKRAFFQSTEALVSYDNDGAQDVYEWEEEGVGSCARDGGCLYLISSGQSERDDYLFGHSQSGDDVFILTSDILLGRDAGATPSIYDAKVDGGFPEPQPVTCEGEGCRPILTPPPVIAPPAKPSGENDNVRETCPKGKRQVVRKGKVRCLNKSCPKGKRKVKRGGKVRCVKKHRRSQGKNKKAGKPGTRRGAGK